MTNHTPTTDYHPWVFWVLDVLIIGPALLIFGLVVLWRMAHDDAKYRAAVSKQKFESIPPDLAEEMGLVKVGGTNLDQHRAKLEEIWRK